MERDPVVERLMRRARTEPRTADACPDAEMLAAWSEGGLRQAERDSLELHLSDCARCQAILAGMVDLAPAPAVVPVSLWRRWHLEWVVPITAAAAAAIVWMIAPRDTPMRVTESARVEQQDQPMPAEPRVEGAPAATQAAQERAAQAVAQEAAAPSPARTDRPAEPEALRRDQALEARTAAEAAPTATGTRAAADATGALRAEPATAAQATDPAQARARAAGVPPAPADIAAPRPATPPPPQAPAGFSGQVVGGVVVRGGASGDARGGAGRGTGGGVGSGTGSGIGAVAAEPVYGLVISPEPAIRWRFSDRGTVDFSTNVGASWDRLQPGVTGALLAGSSPAPTICWIVGRGGVVIVTTDIRTWRRVTFPDAVDLTAVQAVDAQTATVTAADGRRWQTRDGGGTWSTLQDF